MDHGRAPDKEFSNGRWLSALQNKSRIAILQTERNVSNGFHALPLGAIGPCTKGQLSPPGEFAHDRADRSPVVVLQPSPLAHAVIVRRSLEIWNKEWPRSASQKDEYESTKKRLINEYTE
jgi:hypothetical protein